LRKKKNPIAKNILQLFLSLSTMFYSQNVVENIVAKGGEGGFYYYKLNQQPHHTMKDG
jgi:hypothetical protein